MSTHLQNRSFHVAERTRTFFIVKYANLWGFSCRRRRGCLSFLNRKYWENKMMLCYRIQREPQNMAWKLRKVREEFILLTISVWLRFCKLLLWKLNNLLANNLLHSEYFYFVGLVAQQNKFVTEIEEIKKCLRKLHMTARKQDWSFYNKPTLTSIRAVIYVDP